MKTITPVMLILMLPLIGCTTDMNSPYVIKDEPRMIAIESPLPPAELSSQADYVAFDDRSLTDSKRLVSLTNLSVVERETQEFAKTGQANTLALPDKTIMFPYKLEEPVLVCRKMFMSKIVLQEGEQVTDAKAGDSLRWQVEVSYQGNSESYTAIVQVKPLFAGLRTNLSILTDKHEYDIQLSSVDDGEYTPRIGFYYPIEHANKTRGVVQPPKAQGASSYLSSIDMINSETVYEVNGDKRLEWYPVKVVDDGRKVYIKMSEKVRNGELPVLYILNDRGQREVVNTRYVKSCIITDKLFKRAVLVLGGENEQQMISIRKKD